MFGFMDLIVTVIFLFLYILWKRNNDDDKNVVDRQDTLTDRKTCSSILDAQKNLETASQQWKKRVEPSDAINYSVAGRMNQDVKEISESILNFTNADKKKRTPKANRFRGREGKYFISITRLDKINTFENTSIA